MIHTMRGLAGRHHIAVIFLLVLGALLRLRQFLTGRSLWADEAMLALNIVNRDITGMFKPLEYDQGAPVGFLVVEKIANLLFGRNEYALRLFPLLTGILALWLFYLLLRRVVHNDAGLLTALALFALNPRLIYYSSEVKQYILDVFLTIGLLLVASPLLETEARKNDFVYLALAGFAALWFSHPALFILAGIGLALILVYWQRRDFVSLRAILGIGVLWVATIAFLYLLILKDLQQNTYMREYWRGAFLPIPPWSDPGWLVKVLNENIGLQFGLPYAVYLAVGLMLVGWVVLWMEQRKHALVVAFISVATLIASALQLYPVLERMILFTIPIGLILIAKAIEFLYSRFSNHRPLHWIVIVILAGYLLYGPLTTSIGYFLQPKYFEHIRPAMENLKSEWKDGDVLFVTNGAVPAFEYYAPMYGLDGVSYHSSLRQDYANPQNIMEELVLLKGQGRAWILMSHVYERDGFNERDFILEYLRQNGTRRREFRMPGTSVYLYLFDLGN